MARRTPRTPKPERPDLPVIPYVRVSRIGGRQGESFISIDEQKMRIARYAEDKFELTDWHIDPDFSGKNTKRPAFQEALKEIKEGRAGGICVLKLDRFARSVIDAVKTADEIGQVGGRFISVTEEIDLGTAVGHLQFHIFAALAQFELARITESWKNTTENAVMLRGIHISRHTPFGYTRKPDEPRRGMLLPDHETGPIVTEIFERRASGESWGEIVKWLQGTPHRVVTRHKQTDEKLKMSDPWVVRRAKDWSKTTVQGIVANTVYLGEAHSWGTDPEIPEDRRLEFANPDAHEPLIDLATWEAAQQAEGRAGRTGEIAEEAMCRGILRCGSCHNTLIVTGSRQKDPETGEYRRMPIYYCRGEYASGNCVQPVSISSAKIDPFVDEHFRTNLVKPVKAKKVSESSKLPKALERIEKAKRALGYLTDRMAQVIEDEGADAYERRRETLRNELDAAKAAGEEERRKGEMFAKLDTGELGKDWPNLSPSEKNGFLRLLYDRILIAPTSGNKRGRWAPPASERVLSIHLTDL
jgi:site-specific DNA recombinase